jgi:hypothetical protein
MLNWAAGTWPYYEQGQLLLVKRGDIMKRTSIAVLFLTGLATSTVSMADKNIPVYATLSQCQAALADARDVDSIYWLAECRPFGTGWAFTIKYDRPDGKPST